MNVLHILVSNRCYYFSLCGFAVVYLVYRGMLTWSFPGWFCLCACLENGCASIPVSECFSL